MKLPFRMTALLLMGIGLSGCGPGDNAGDGPGRGFAVQVRMEPVVVDAVEESIRLVGSLQASDQVAVRPELDGVIAAIEFEEGQPVQGGAPLFRLDDEELRARLTEAEAELALLELNFQRTEQLLKTRAISSQEFDEAMAGRNAQRARVDLFRRQLRQGRVVAPFDGVTGPRLVSRGQYVQTDTVLTTVVALEPIRAVFEVPERFVAVIEQGQTVLIEVAAYPGETFEGRLFFISPEVTPATRTVQVKAEVPNEEGRLKPGMFAEMRLVLEIRPEAVVIPEEAVTIVSREPRVFVVEKGVAVMRTVRTGRRMAGRVEIVEGVGAGETIIVSGLQKVRDGAPVTAAERSAPKMTTAR